LSFHTCELNIPVSLQLLSVVNVIVKGHAKLCMLGWHWLYSYFAVASPAIMVTAVMSVDSSLTADRQQELLKAFLTADGSKVNPKQNLATSSDSSQMVTGTNKVAHKAGNRRCPKSVLTALT